MFEVSFNLKEVRFPVIFILAVTLKPTPTAKSSGSGLSPFFTTDFDVKIGLYNEAN